MSDDEVWEFLEKGHTGILTTLRADGWPVSLPLWYVVVDRRMYVSTREKAKLVTRLRRDDRACFLVESGEAWTDLAGVEVPVRASVVERGGEARAALGAFIKYSRFQPAPNRLPGATTKHYSQRRALIRLDPAGPALSWDNARVRLNPDERVSTR